jgi:hypothetical protein
MKLKIILRITRCTFSLGEQRWVPSVVLESPDIGDHTLWEGDYQKTKAAAYRLLRKHRPVVSRRPGIEEVDRT